MPLESSVGDTTLWSVTLESSISIMEASFTLIYDAYNTAITPPPLSFYSASGRVQASLVLPYSATWAQPVLLTKFIFALPFNPVISSGSL
jgi:hypothetical protein